MKKNMLIFSLLIGMLLSGCDGTGRVPSLPAPKPPDKTETQGELFIISGGDTPYSAYTGAEPPDTVVNERGEVVVRGGNYSILYDPVSGRAIAIAERRILDCGGERETFEYDGKSLVNVSDGVRQQRIYAADGRLLADWEARSYAPGPTGTLLYTSSEWESFTRATKSPAECGSLVLSTGEIKTSGLVLFSVLDGTTACYLTQEGDYGLCDLEGGSRTPLPDGMNYARGFSGIDGLYAVGRAEFGMGESTILETILMRRDGTVLVGPGFSYFFETGGVILGEHQDMYDDSGSLVPAAPPVVFEKNGKIIYTAPENFSILYCDTSVVLIRQQETKAASLFRLDGEEIARGEIWHVFQTSGNDALFTLREGMVTHILRRDGTELPLPEEGVEQVHSVFPNGNVLVSLSNETEWEWGDSQQFALIRPAGEIDRIEGEYVGASSLQDRRQRYSSAATENNSPFFRLDVSEAGKNVFSNSTLFNQDGTILLTNVNSVSLCGNYFILRKGFTRGVMDTSGKWIYQERCFTGMDE